MHPGKPVVFNEIGRAAEHGLVPDLHAGKGFLKDTAQLWRWFFPSHDFSPGFIS
jgi:hypothetical protein